MSRLLPLLILLGCEGPTVGQSQDRSSKALPAAGTHPFLELGRLGADAKSHKYDGAEIIDPDYGVVAGKLGLVVFRLDGAEEIYLHEADDIESPLSGDNVTYDSSTDLVWMALSGLMGDLDGVAQFDVSEPTAPVLLDSFLHKRQVRSVSANGGILLAGTTESAYILDAAGTLQSTIVLDVSHGVGVYGDRAAIASGSELLLYDLSDLSEPKLLDQVQMTADGWDVDFDGTRVAVALGSSGVATYRVAGDVLSESGVLNFPHSTFDLAMDGHDLWIAGWSGVWLADIRADPFLLGESPTVGFAMGIGAGYGRAIVGEIDVLRTLQRVPGAGGAEITIPEALQFPAGIESTESLEIRNDGMLPMEVTFQCDGCAVSTDQIEIAPSTRARVEVSTSDPEGSRLTWRSSDPSEPKGTVDLLLADDIVGQPHPEFSSTWFRWPADRLKTIDQSALLGRVTYLYYFKDT